MAQIFDENLKNRLESAFEALRSAGSVHTKGDLAVLLGVNRSSLSRAMNGDPQYLTESLTRKAEAAVKNIGTTPTQSPDTIPVIPTGARAGTLADWADNFSEYDCERIVSPIKGADYAIQVTGDSMSPEYPSGSQIIIKKIDEAAFIEWGKVYLLDTKNGPVLKQVRRTDTDGVVECVSLNPAYQPFTIECRYIRGWYRVLMCLSLK